VKDGDSLVKNDASHAEEGGSFVKDGASLMKDGAPLVKNDASHAEDGASIVKDGASHA
jgi:hypothetical protein